MNARRTVTGILSIAIAIGVNWAFLAAQEDLPGDRRERVLERIEMMRMWKMTEELELTEETGAVLFPFLREIDEERKGVEDDRRDVIRELRATLRGENPDQDAINELLGRLEKIKDRSRELEDREYARIREILNPEQVARYFIFKREFEREIRDVIFRARRDEPPKGVPGRVEPPPREEERFR